MLKIYGVREVKRNGKLMVLYLVREVNKPTFKWVTIGEYLNAKLQYMG